MPQQRIPKIIHQIWSGIDEPLPDFFRELGETWKEFHPEWKYELWNHERMEQFIKEFYPEKWDMYNRFPHNIQRWDAIRYLILDKIGGMYVDFDYEALKSLQPLLKDKSCCFALEPESHCKNFNMPLMFNNALMACVPEHPFMRKIIDNVFTLENILTREPDRTKYILKTTGPWILIKLYENSGNEEQKDIYLIPCKYVTPFDNSQAVSLRSGLYNEELERTLDDAYAVHYFFGGWVTD